MSANCFIFWGDFVTETPYVTQTPYRGFAPWTPLEDFRPPEPGAIAPPLQKDPGAVTAVNRCNARDHDTSTKLT